jgi:hypothetical protein
MNTGPIQPLASAIAASTLAGTVNASARNKLTRVGTVARTDTFERQVETAQAIDPARRDDDSHPDQQRKRKQHEKEQTPVIDIEA